MTESFVKHTHVISLKHTLVSYHGILTLWANVANLLFDTLFHHVILVKSDSVSITYWLLCNTHFHDNL